MKNILILNGSPRKNGKTASLVKAFTEGAEAAGNSVREVYVDGMNIASCKACEACSHNGGFCPQKDDMEKVNEDYLWADVIVFASPMYWGTITGQLKTVIDRLYAVQNRLGYGNVIGHMETAFIMDCTRRVLSACIGLLFCIYGCYAMEKLGNSSWCRKRSGSL